MGGGISKGTVNYIDWYLFYQPFFNLNLERYEKKTKENTNFNRIWTQNIGSWFFHIGAWSRISKEQWKDLNKQQYFFSWSQKKVKLKSQQDLNSKNKCMKLNIVRLSTQWSPILATPSSPIQYCCAVLFMLEIRMCGESYLSSSLFNICFMLAWIEKFNRIFWLCLYIAPALVKSPCNL